MILKKYLIGVAVLALLILSASAFGQSTASIGGTVTDATGGVVPGATITVTNEATGIAQTVLTNDAGAYSLTGLPVGNYEVTVEMRGFQTQTSKDVRLGAASQLRMNFELEVATGEYAIEVSVDAENLLLESGSSVGVVLPEEKITELPLVNSNVLDLIKVMGGVNPTDSPTFGADRTTFAGVSAANINLQRDGVTVNDVRWETGLNSPVFLNPELIGEFKLVIAPVDAEMGRGSGQVQVITRSGANEFHGSAVWNIQNTAIDANHWYQNITGTQVNWRNQNEYTLTLGGPVIKNKTFFFVSWDHQITRIREHNVNPQLPTPCARKGIFRWFDGYANGNYQTVPSTGTSRTSPSTVKTVYADGTPRIGAYTVPGYMPNAGAESQLLATGFFGPLQPGKLAALQNDPFCDSVQVDSNGLATSDWIDYSQPYDPLRTPDASGYVSRFMQIIPDRVNNYDVGDGLNWAGYRWVRTNKGIDNVYGLGEGPNRKQISFRIDHNFNSAHRLSGTYSWETNNGEDAQPMWPQNSYGGNISREPRSVSISLTSTFKPTVLNEFRWGLSRTESFTVSPLHNTLDNSAQKLRNLLKELYPPSNLPNYNPDLPILIGLGEEATFGASSPTFQIYGGSNPYGSGRGNVGVQRGGHDPRMIFADTLTWTRGRHSFKFGGEYQRTQSYQEINGTISFGSANITYPHAVGGESANYPNQGFYIPSFFAPSWTVDGMVGDQDGNIVGGIHNLLNIYSGSLASVGQYYFINESTATSYNDILAGEDLRITDYRENQLNLFLKDDWKITDDLTLNLGVRWEWYGVPYLKNGMTAGLKEGALSLFGRSGRSFDDWMKVPEFTPGEEITYKGTDAEIAFIGPDSPNPDMQLYNDDYNNFGPAVGFAWQLPWFGKGKTTIRGGYQMTFVPGGRADSLITYAPGVVRDFSYDFDDVTSNQGYVNLSTLPNYVPVPIPEYMKTPAEDPKIPVFQRQESLTMYDPELQTPYIQNLTLSVTRNIGSNLTVDLRYIGTLSRKQRSTINLNSANFIDNGLKELFDCARTGCTDTALNAELDRMFWGVSLNDPLWGYGPVGTTHPYFGYQSGAAHLRGFQGVNLANADYAAVASAIATANINPVYNPGLPAPEPYTAGGVLRYTGYPENFIYTSPQFLAANWVGNHNNANYHSMQAQVTLRPTHGFSVTGTYTWSRNLGALGVGGFGQAYMDPRNRALDYGLLNTHRSHAFTMYGTWDLPFGRNRWVASDAGRVVDGIIGGWQLSWIHTMQTGRPARISATNTLWGGGWLGDNLIDLAPGADFDTKSGKISWENGARTGSYFDNRYIAVPDPQCQDVTAAQGLNVFCWIKAAALADDPDTIIFQNPLPGERGNFARGQITTPMTWNTDMALTKVVRLTEGTNLTVRVDATNVWNHPIASNGVFAASGSRVAAPGDFAGNITMVDINWFNFANRAPGYLDTKIGARTFQAKIRIDF